MLYLLYSASLEPLESPLWFAGNPEIRLMQEQAYYDYQRFQEEEKNYLEHLKEKLELTETELEQIRKRMQNVYRKLNELKLAVGDPERGLKLLKDYHGGSRFFLAIVENRMREGDENPELPGVCKRLKQFLEREKQRIESIEKVIQATISYRQSLEKRVSELGKELEKKEPTIQRLEEELERTNKKLQDANKKNKGLKNRIEKLTQARSDGPEQLEIKRLQAELQSERDKNKRQETALERIKKEKAELEAAVSEGKKKKYWLDQREAEIQRREADLIKEREGVKQKKEMLQRDEQYYDKMERALTETLKKFKFINNDDEIRAIMKAYYANAIGNVDKLSLRIKYDGEQVLERIDEEYLCHKYDFDVFYEGDYPKKKSAFPLAVLTAEGWLLTEGGKKLILKNPKLSCVLDDEKQIDDLKFIYSPLVGSFLMHHVLFKKLIKIEEVMMPATELLDPLWFGLSKLKREGVGEYVKITKQDIARYFENVEEAKKAIESHSGEFAFCPLENFNGYSLAYIKEDGEPVDVLIFKGCTIEGDVLNLSGAEVLPVIDIKNAHEAWPFLFGKFVTLLETVQKIQIMGRDTNAPYWKFFQGKECVREGNMRIYDKGVFLK